MTKKEQDFSNEMIFLKRAFAYGRWQVERALDAIQRSVYEPDRFLNCSVNTDALIKAGKFMNEAEERTVKLYRKYHNLG